MERRPGASSSLCVRANNRQISVRGKRYANCLRMAQHSFTVPSTHTRIWFANHSAGLCIRGFYYAVQRKLRHLSSLNLVYTLRQPYCTWLCSCFTRSVARQKKLAAKTFVIPLVGIVRISEKCQFFSVFPRLSTIVDTMYLQNTVAYISIRIWIEKLKSSS